MLKLSPKAVELNVDVMSDLNFASSRIQYRQYCYQLHSSYTHGAKSHRLSRSPVLVVFVWNWRQSRYDLDRPDPWGVSTGTRSNNGVLSKSYNIIQVHQTPDFLLPSELQDTPMHFFRHEFA